MNISKRLSFSALSKPVAASTSDLISVRWRGKSYVAAGAQEPSDLPKRRRGRIPLEERKAVVQCYVNKYRAINPGKFPTPSEAKRQVGGSYYVIRKLIQELQHQAKISPMSKVETQDEVIKDGKILPGPHHVPISNMKIHKNIHQDGQATEARDYNQDGQATEARDYNQDGRATEARDHNQDGQATEARDHNLSLKEAGTISSVKLPSVVQVQEENMVQRDIQASPEIESAKNDESLQKLKDKPKVEPTDFQQQLHNSEYNAKMHALEFDKLEPEPGQLHQTQKLGTVTRDSPKHQLDDAEVVTKSNMWDDLKSFAGGIFSFFKKR